ncbi:MAG: hypothetical protein IT162_08135 [Bryobacterales bacterium]|nr:hypothetical protein [Bryobacterales bacterium]
MNGLILCQKINKEGRHDATGAFIPGARMFQKLHGLGAPVWLDDVDDRSTMLKAIRKGSGWQTIAYFGHGSGGGLGSAEIRGTSGLADLASAISASAAPGCRVIFYACSAGKPGKFAHQLASLLGNRYTIYGHTCAGHSFTNPYVTRFPYPGDTSPYLVEPGTALFQRWYKYIKSGSDIWARFPFMPKTVLHREIETGIKAPLQPFYVAGDMWDRLKVTATGHL